MPRAEDLNTDFGARKTIARRLSRLLIDRLNPLLPEEFRGKKLVSTEVLESLVDQPGDLETNLETAARFALNDVQDFIVEQLKLPWPADPKGSLATLHTANASVDEDQLKMWFGAGQLVSLVPISLRELTSPDES